MDHRKVGETTGIGIGAAINLTVKLMVIAACGRYLGWW